MFRTSLPSDWADALQHVTSTEAFAETVRFVNHERDRERIYPPEDEMFQAFDLTPLANVRVVILGQDPYHDEGQAHGLCFSVRRGVKYPPSLRNIFVELKEDVHCPMPIHGDLSDWAKQGVLLLNTVLTVRAHEPNSHKNHGWEEFTDAAIQAVAARPERTVFILWGTHARKKSSFLDPAKHVVIASAHPSPLSARNGFFGSKPFSKTNEQLKAWNEDTIDWCRGLQQV